MILNEKLADYIMMHYSIRTQCAFKDAGYKWQQFESAEKMIEKLREIRDGGMEGWRDGEKMLTQQQKLQLIHILEANYGPVVKDLGQRVQIGNFILPWMMVWDKYNK